jgi:hypothetical protein
VGRGGQEAADRARERDGGDQRGAARNLRLPVMEGVIQVLVPARNDLHHEGKLPQRPDIIVIGHNFGARVVTWTAFCGGLRAAPGGADAKLLGPDYVIGLQGAFSLARFVAGKGVEGALYTERPAGTRFVYTSSENDKAVETFNTLSGPINKAIADSANFLHIPGLDEAHLGVPHIGGKTAFSLNSEEYRRVIEHRTVADPAGHLDRPVPTTGEKVVLIDASAIIKAPDAGLAEFLGAHGDVYNEGVGRLIWQVIAPAPPTR